MRTIAVFCFLLLACGEPSSEKPPLSPKINTVYHSRKTEPQTWAYFLQHLPVVDGPILDYRGEPIVNQAKHAGIIPYDVGNADLQQCADALMRLRAEYLFSEGKYDSIGFHFVSGPYYSWNDYCNGLRPAPSGNSIRWTHGAAQKKDHSSLRAYLNIVYMYASTISLAKELKPAPGYGIGTVIIHPGSPGHCFIVIDERTDQAGQKTYRLAEGYTPAQSIYVLRNPKSTNNDPWQPLSTGTITTASCIFMSYEVKGF